MKTKEKKIFTKQDLVSFGNYLLSQQREKTIVHKEVKRMVGHHDIENWKAFVENISNN